MWPKVGHDQTELVAHPGLVFKEGDIDAGDGGVAMDAEREIGPQVAVDQYIAEELGRGFGVDVAVCDAGHVWRGDVDDGIGPREADIADFKDARLNTKFINSAADGLKGLARADGQGGGGDADADAGDCGIVPLSPRGVGFLFECVVDVRCHLTPHPNPLPQGEGSSDWLRVPPRCAV